MLVRHSNVCSDRLALQRNRFFFFNGPATPEIYPLSLPDALPICRIGELTDESLFVLGDSAEIVERIVKRHLAAGIASTEAEARDRAMGSDQLNALYVVEHSRTPEIEIVN